MAKKRKELDLRDEETRRSFISEGIADVHCHCTKHEVKIYSFVYDTFSLIPNGDIPIHLFSFAVYPNMEECKVAYRLCNGEFEKKVICSSELMKYKHCYLVKMISSKYGERKEENRLSIFANSRESAQKVARLLLNSRYWPLSESLEIDSKTIERIL